MRLLMDRELYEGEQVPRGWGVAYRRYDRHAAVIAPVPFNWFIGWARRLYYAMWWPIKMGPQQSAYDAGVADGMRAGLESAKCREVQFNAAVMDEVERRFAAAVRLLRVRRDA